VGEVAAVKRRLLKRGRVATILACAAWLPLLCVVWPRRPYLVDLVAQLSMPAGAVVCVLGVTLLILRRRRQAAATLLAGTTIMLVAALLAGVGSLPEVGSSDGGLVRVRVVSFNAHSNASAGDAEFARWLLRQDADLVCVVDPPTNFPQDNPQIAEAFPFVAAPQHGMDWPIVWLSRTPVESVELVPYAEPTKFSVPARRTLRVTVDDGAQVLFTGMYPRSPRLYSYWRQSVHSVTVDASVIKRWLGERPDDSPPLIIAGDFNSTPTGRTHSIMRTSGLRPWSPMFGAGTFPAWLPRWCSLPLDRVWASDGVSVTRWAVGPRFRSDHRPVVIDLHVRRR
jgi:endonuclease/exonuclease/phosphatase (EEP) superfamily protein YafD